MDVKIYKFKNREPESWVKLDCDGTIKPLYEISTYGRIRNLSGKILKGYIDKDGYIKYTLQGYGKKVHRFAHRLVAKQFIPNPENKKEVNHRRVRKQEGYVGISPHDDNYYKNLEWSTRKENIIHSRENILQARRSCEAGSNAKVSNEVVHFICLMLEKGYSNVEIRRMLGIPKDNKKLDEQYRGLIKHVKSRRHWEGVSQFYKF